jgi:hypothetical protein
LRRHFQLSKADEEYLQARSLEWETLVENGQWLILQDFPIPEGYNHRTALAAINIPSSYPDSQLDMVYFYPGLARTDGKPIQGLTPHLLDGKEWQRWSRHRTAQNPWRPGEDDLSSHILLIEDWLRREFILR